MYNKILTKAVALVPLTALLINPVQTMAGSNHTYASVNNVVAAKKAKYEKEIGIFQKDLVQEKITNGSFAPNAPSTVMAKGSSKPLIDTGRMRQSVNYVIQQKGSGD